MRYICPVCNTPFEVSSLGQWLYKVLLTKNNKSSRVPVCSYTCCRKYNNCNHTNTKKESEI